MEFVLVLAVLVVAVLLIAEPLRRRTGGQDSVRSPDRAALEAAREAKFREIRDAELDYRMGKLSRDDWRAIDSALRAEAIEVLDKLDALEDSTRGADRRRREDSPPKG